MLTYNDFKASSEILIKFDIMKNETVKNIKSTENMLIVCLNALEKQEIFDNFVDFIDLIVRLDNPSVLYWVFSKDEFINLFPQIDRAILRVAIENMFSKSIENKNKISNSIFSFLKNYVESLKKINLLIENFHPMHGALKKYGVSFIHESPSAKTLLSPDSKNVGYIYNGLRESRNVIWMNKLHELNKIPREQLKDAFTNNVNFLDVTLRKSFFEEISKYSLNCKPFVLSIMLEVALEQNLLTKESIKYDYTNQIVKKIITDTTFVDGSKYREFLEYGFCVSLNLVEEMLGDKCNIFKNSELFIVNLPWLTASKEFNPDFFLESVQIDRIKNCNKLQDTIKNDLIKFFSIVKEEKNAENLRLILDQKISIEETNNDYIDNEFANNIKI